MENSSNNILPIEVSKSTNKILKEQLLSNLQFAINNYESVLQNQDPPLKEEDNILKAIQRVSRMINEKDLDNAKPLKRKSVESLIKPLKNKSDKKKKMTFDERVQKGIKEIFSFYCNQKILNKEQKTFDSMSLISSQLELPMIQKLMKDFEIPIDKIVFHKIVNKRSFYEKSEYEKIS